MTPVPEKGTIVIRSLFIPNSTATCQPSLLSKWTPSLILFLLSPMYLNTQLLYAITVLELLAFPYKNPTHSSKFSSPLYRQIDNTYSPSCFHWQGCLRHCCSSLQLEDDISENHGRNSHSRLCRASDLRCYLCHLEEDQSDSSLKAVYTCIQLMSMILHFQINCWPKGNRNHFVFYNAQSTEQLRWSAHVQWGCVQIHVKMEYLLVYSSNCFPGSYDTRGYIEIFRINRGHGYLKRQGKYIFRHSSAMCFPKSQLSHQILVVRK